MGRFRRGQPPFQEQLLDQLRHELVSRSIVTFPVTEAGDLKMFREVRRDRIGDVQIGSLGPAMFQDEGCDLLAFGLQCGAVLLAAQIGVFFIAVYGIASEGFAF